MEPPARRRAAFLFIAVVALTFAMRAGVMVLEHGSLHAVARFSLANDARRYHQIAEAPGTPYRDFPVEVPPVGLGLIEVIDGSSNRDTALRLGWSQVLLDLAVVVALALGWGRATAMAYLLISTPLIFFVYFRIDLLSVALAVGGLALVRRGRERAGGVGLALAVMAKVWPIVLAPLLLIRGQRRAVLWMSGGVLLGTAAWVAWAGWDGPRQVLTFRGAHGWQIESVVGAVAYVFDPHSTLQGGAVRVGDAPVWARGLLLLAALGVMTVAWTWARRRPDRAEGVGSLAAVGALLICSPLLSAQFVSWLLPWAAIAAAAGALELGGLAVLVMALTTAFTFNSTALAEHSWGGMGPLIARNAALVALVALALRRLTSARGAQVEGGNETRRKTSPSSSS